MQEGCQIPPRESSEEEKGEAVTGPPPAEEEEKEGWSSSSEGWETSDDDEDDRKGGKEGRERRGKGKGKRKGKKQVLTCWMFWECCECGVNNAPERGKCRECGKVKCDLCYRRLPRKVAVVGDFM